MSKIENFFVNDKDYGWVIKVNDNDLYIYSGYKTIDKLVLADIYECESQANAIIDAYNLQNCKPVKIEIRVVGEWYGREN